MRKQVLVIAIVIASAILFRPAHLIQELILETVVVICKNKKLWAVIRSGKPLELIPVGNNQFNGSGMPSPIRLLVMFPEGLRDLWIMDWCRYRLLRSLR